MLVFLLRGVLRLLNQCLYYTSVHLNLDEARFKCSSGTRNMWLKSADLEPL